MGLYELLEVTEDVQSLILTNPSLDEIRRHLKGKGNITMEIEGVKRVREQLTTFEEVSRAVTLGGA